MTFKLGRLNIIIEPDALYAWLIMAVVIEVIALFAVDLQLFSAIIVGFVVTGLFVINNTIHQLGHATFARWAGHPMEGIRYTRLFTQSLYPKNERDVSKRAHIQRSLGGVAGAGVALSAALTLFLITQGRAPAPEFMGVANLISAGLIFLVTGIWTDGILFIRNKGWHT